MELIGFDENHIVENVLFDNVVLDGRKVTAENVTMNEFVRDVRFELEDSHPAISRERVSSQSTCRFPN